MPAFTHCVLYLHTRVTLPAAFSCLHCTPHYLHYCLVFHCCLPPVQQLYHQLLCVRFPPALHRRLLPAATLHAVFVYRYAPRSAFYTVQDFLHSTYFLTLPRTFWLPFIHTVCTFAGFVAAVCLHCTRLRTCVLYAVPAWMHTVFHHIVQCLPYTLYLLAPYAPPAHLPRLPPYYTCHHGWVLDYVLPIPVVDFTPPPAVDTLRRTCHHARFSRFSSATLLFTQFSTCHLLYWRSVSYKTFVRLPAYLPGLLTYTYAFYTYARSGPFFAPHYLRFSFPCALPAHALLYLLLTCCLPAYTATTCCHCYHFTYCLRTLHTTLLHHCTPFWFHVRFYSVLPNSGWNVLFSSARSVLCFHYYHLPPATHPQQFPTDSAHALFTTWVQFWNSICSTFYTLFLLGGVGTLHFILLCILSHACTGPILSSGT